MLNVGPLELLVVLAVALIVVGPERLPELARSVGRAFRQLRQVQDEVRDMVSTGVDDDMRRAAAEFREATGDVARAAGVGDLRKAGRASSRRPMRTRPLGTADEAGASRRTATAGEPEPAPTPTPTSSGTAPEPAAAPDADAEAAGPPSDRLLEDGAPAAPEPPVDDAADGSAAEG